MPSPRVRPGLLALAAVASLGACKPTKAAPGGARDGSDAATVTGPATKGAGPSADVGVLRRFGSRAELAAFTQELAARERARGAKWSAGPSSLADLAASEGAGAPAALPTPAPAPAPAGGGESITNVQHAGVDEGDIVKVHGRHLVVLRRGRLFTIEIGKDALTPVDVQDAYGPGIDPSGAWYDEMLIARGTVVVVGYSYRRGGTELGLFDIDEGGRLSPRGTFHLRASDYYSSRNYASRLIGDKLIFYSPVTVRYTSEAEAWLPAVRKWEPGASPSGFTAVIEPHEIYRPTADADDGPLTLHTVTVCDLAKPGFACRARGLMGPPGRVFYVSPDAVYVWTALSSWRSSEESSSLPRSILYRLPLEGGAPSALRVHGAPLDQLSFHEGEDSLDVLVRADGVGDAMWLSERGSSGALAALRIPRSRFAPEALDVVPAAAYTPLTKPDGYALQNRIVSGHLLYGTGSGWGPGRPPRDPHVYVHRLGSGEDALPLDLGHGVDRLEALGHGAVVVGGSGDDLVLSAIDLDVVPKKVGEHRVPGVVQGETRTHGFFYKPESRHAGLLGLPVRSGGARGSRLSHGSAEILFLRNEALRLSPLGALAALSETSGDDGCRASCLDWYGNARPIFLGSRVFALLGYELVEGELAGGALREARRVSFAPRGRR